MSTDPAAGPTAGGTNPAEPVALATAIASRPLASVMATKKLIAEAERAGIDRARKAEGAAFAELLAQPMMDHAIRAHLKAASGSPPAG